MHSRGSVSPRRIPSALASLQPPPASEMPGHVHPQLPARRPHVGPYLRDGQRHMHPHLPARHGPSTAPSIIIPDVFTTESDHLSSFPVNFFLFDQRIFLSATVAFCRPFVIVSRQEPSGSDCYWRKMLMALSLRVRPPGKPRIYHPRLRGNGANRPFAGLPRRGGCSESCFSVSTGTCRPKAWAGSPGPIPTLDPMDAPNLGRPRHPSVCDCCSLRSPSEP
jgi:hypothetical protein